MNEELKPIDLVLFPEFGQPITMISEEPKIIVDPMPNIEDMPIATAIEIDYDNAIDDKITPEMVMRTTTALGPEKVKSSVDLNNLIPFVLVGFGLYLILKD